jgi:hypothetical protein
MAASDDARPQPDMNAILNGLTTADVSQQPPSPPQAAQGEPNGAPPATPSGGPDVDAMIDNFSADDLIDNYQPEQQPTDAIGMPQDDYAAATQSAQQVAGVLGSAALGAAKGVLEAKDFVFGEPKEEDKSSVRTWIEGKSKELRAESTANGLAEGIAQFGVGFVGLGKVGWVAKGLEKASEVGRLAHWSAEAARGAAAGAIFIDPHEERLSNLVQQYPALSNPVSAYLAAKPDDTAAEGRLKNALEGIVLDAGLSSALTLAAKSIRHFRAGDLKAADTAAAEADAAFTTKAPGADSSSPLRDDSTGLNVDGQQTGGRDAITEGPGQGGEHGDASGDVRILDGDARDARGVPSGQPIGEDGQILPQRNAAMADGGGLGVDGVRRYAEEVSAQLEQARSDTSVLIQHGGRDAAIDAGYTFTAPRSDRSGLIPWQKLQTTEDTHTWMDYIIRNQADYINARRGGDAKGVMSDADMTSMLADRAKVWNEDPADLAGILKASGDAAPSLAANMETSFLIANKAYQDAYELAQRVSAENYTGYGSRAEAIAAMQHMTAQATVMYANGKAILTNAARSMRRMRSEFKFTPEQLDNIRTADPEQLLKLINETKGDPALLTKASRITAMQRVFDWMTGLHAANLLWSWKTQAVNAATSAAMLVWRPLETGIGSYGLKALGKVRGDEAMMANADSIRRQSVREVTYLGSMLHDGWNAAYRTFIEGDSVLAPRMQEHLSTSSLTGDNLKDIASSFRPMNTMADVAHNAVAAGVGLRATITGDLRLMGGVDEMVKQLRYRAVVASRASLAADDIGLIAGTRVYDDFVAYRIDASFDVAGRGIDPDALREAQTSAFQNDYVSGADTWLGGEGWARGYANLAANHSYLKIITPFIKTPTNLMRYGIKLTPGINLLQKEFVNAISGKAGPEAAARAIGQMTLGMMLGGIGASLWASGRITGSPPQNPEQAKTWRRQGNRPYSITWTNSEGGRSYFDLNPFDPIAQPLILIADIAAIHNSGVVNENEVHGLTQSAVLALMHRFNDKMYLKSIGDFIAALKDDNTIESWTKRTAPGFLPFSTLMPTVNPDPHMREVRTVADSLIARIPGWSSTLPPARDIYGDPVMVPSGLVSHQQHPAGILAVNRELDEMRAATGWYLSPPAARGENTGGVDLRDFKLADGRTAYDRYQELAGHPKGAPPLSAALSDLVQRPDFQRLPHGSPTVHGTRESAFMDVVKTYREAGWKLVRRESPELLQAVNQRKLDTWRAAMTGAKNVRDVAGQTRLDDLNNRLLKPYGLGLPSVTLPKQ